MPAVNSNPQTYFANLAGEELGGALFKKINDYREYLYSSGQLVLWQNCFDAYYQEFYSGGQNTKSGNQAQYTNSKINHFKSILDRLQSVISQQRIKWSARATNSDSQSLKQTILANQLLDYYLRTKQLTELEQAALNWGFLTGEGFLSCTWDSQSGKIVGQIDENANPDGSIPSYPPDADGNVPEHEPSHIDIHEGDIRAAVFDPTCVVRDCQSYSWEACDWIITIESRNKFDEAAKYPELADKITALSLDACGEKEWHFTSNWWSHSDDLIAVYHFYHKKTPACPAGRYVKMYTDDLVVIETGLPYETIPVHRFAPQEHLGTPFGYSVSANLLPIQQSADILNDTIITNHEVFGVQSVVGVRGSGPEWQQLANGMSYVEVNPAENGQINKPEGLNLLAVSPDSYAYQTKLEQEMQLISGINSVARGEPPEGVTAGVALALIQSMAIQTNMPAQLRLVTFRERYGSAIISILREYAQVPRLAEIAGEENRSFVKSFSSKDLDKVQRVLVELGNPLTDTTAGRVALAEQLLQAHMVTTPQEFLTVINTGNLDPLTQGDQMELLLIRQENEMLSDGKGVIALQFDAHQLHINEHKAVLADPETRTNAPFVQNVTDHIQAHMNFLNPPAPPGLPGAPPPAPMLPPHPQTPQGPAPAPGVPHGPPVGAPAQGGSPAQKAAALTTPATAGAATAQLAAQAKPAQSPLQGKV